MHINELKDVVVGPNSLIKKHEFVRLIIQALYALGYTNTAKELECESGYVYKSKELKSIESNVISGNWDWCVEELSLLEEWKGDGERGRDSALFMVFRQWVLEELKCGDDMAALEILRKRVGRLEVEDSMVRKLAVGIVSLEDVDDGGGVEKLRSRLVMELGKVLPVSIALPERRLENLIEKAIDAQVGSCMYHNTYKPISLYEDHSCERELFPTETVQILNDHQNEVWFVQFSNTGKYLASASSDCSAIIWKVSEEGILSVKHTLKSHKNPVSFVSWSPEDTMLLTCGTSEVLKLWDVELGTCRHIFGNNIISSCAWFPDSKRVVCGSTEPVKCIYIWDLDGNELDAWKGARMPIISDLSVTPDGEHLISICSEKDIRIYKFSTKTEWVIMEEHAITSLSVSKESKYLIVNLNNEEIHMWDVAGTWQKPFKFVGHKQGKYVIRSCFGGLNDLFIASGSESSQVFIWNDQCSKPIEVLSGHSMIVNSVSWNPTRPQMLASASDDQTIRIWGPSSKATS